MNVRKDINAFILYGLSKCFIDAAVFAFFGYNGCRFSACSSVCCAFCAWILLLSLFKDFFAKTVYDIRFDFRWKFFTISKSHVSNICYTIRNIDTGEWTASMKSTISNICHTIRNIDISEWIALRKSPIPNIYHTIWNVDFGEWFTVIKSPISNICHTI